jgi:hypothetical protein
MAVKRTRRPVPPDSPAIPARELARALGVGLNLIYAGCADGTIRHFKLGHRVIIRRIEATRLLGLDQTSKPALPKPARPKVVAVAKAKQEVLTFAKNKRKPKAEARP